MGVYGMAVVCSLTYQSTKGLAGRYDLPAGIVRNQFNTLLEDRRPDAVKTGALGRTGAIVEVARLCKAHGLDRLGSSRHLGPKTEVPCGPGSWHLHYVTNEAPQRVEDSP